MGDQPIPGTKEIVLCIFHILPIDRNRHIQLPDHSIRTHRLLHEHIIDLFAVLIQPVILHGDKYCLFQLFLIQSADNDRQFCCGAAVKEIQDVFIFHKHGFFIFLRCHFKVNVCKTIRLCVLVFPY